MRIFITGVTGYIGSVVAEKLLAQGHEVVGLARSEAAEAALRRGAIIVHRGDLRDASSLAAPVNTCDAVIHTAVSREPDAQRWEQESVGAMLNAMRGTRKMFIYTSGASVVGDTGGIVADEYHPTNPDNFRAQIEERVLDEVGQGVHVTIIRPSFVYGREQGILRRYTDHAREKGVAGYVLPGDNQWNFVHVDDLAMLYCLALENSPSHTIFNAAAGESLPMVSLSEEIALRVGAKLTAWTPSEAAPIIGRIAFLLATTLRVSSKQAQNELAWQPSAPTVIDEIHTLLA